ncbi:MAG: hypothetical protein FJ009_11980 [Chloroflexi bacterium]|nr:hypothetical protein [Chloroflexota bacterium]
MIYLRCIKNKGYAASLEIGKIYKTLPTTALERRNRQVRVIDNEGEDYLYDREYFEPVEVKLAREYKPGLSTLTIHLPPLLKSILQAEALANRKSASALVREWIDERLDLPTH